MLKMPSLSQRRGFTLIEILIVVAIIGILASVVLVGLGPVQQKGRDARRISDLKQIQTGLELYFAKNGVYPTGPFADWSAFQAALIGAGVGVTNVPQDPSTASTYNYGTTGGTTYTLSTTLEDTGNPALNNDIDGVSDGLGCADPVYCVQL